MKNITKDFILSPNFNARPKPAIITTIVIHHTVISYAKTIELFQQTASKVSAHYVINLDGETVQMVNTNHRAWHAGKSSWRGNTDINSQSIGIELVNTGVEPFTNPQIDSLIELCKNLIAIYPTIEHRNIVGHADVAIGRKIDPNKHFPWNKLWDAEIGIYPQINGFHHPIPLNSRELLHLQKRLRSYGYGTEITGVLDKQTQSSINAFKQHFCSHNFQENGKNHWTEEDDKRLEEILDLAACRGAVTTTT